MNTSRVLLALQTLPLPQRRFLLFAAVMAVALLSTYVQLLHTSLARGDELREMQRNALASLVTPALPHPPQAATLVRVKNGPDNAAQTR
jgi:hypothetical protein